MRMNKKGKEGNNTLILALTETQMMKRVEETTINIGRGGGEYRGKGIKFNKV